MIVNNDLYLQLKQRIIDLGYQDEIDWASSIKPCENSLNFFMEYSWVVLCSGMKEQIARKIWHKILSAIENGKNASDVFGHKGKATAIDTMRHRRLERFTEYQKSQDKLSFLQSLPWIGPITKYHLAKNLGLECIKPDRHLVRIAASEGKTPNELCQQLSGETGDRLVLVDTVIWRSANLGLL
jgi:hypothetical protein